MNYRKSRVAASVHLVLLMFPVLLVTLNGCSSRDEHDTDYSFRIFKENGITVAETLGGPRYEGELFEYVPVLIIESGDTEEKMLFDPDDFIADSDGWFYVSDPGNGDIVVFDPEGRFHKRFGRQGSGPGEFQYAELICTEGDMLYVFDQLQMRTTRFRRSGELVDMITVHRGMTTTVMLGSTALLPLPGDDRLLLSVGYDTAGGRRDSWCDATRLDADGDTVWNWRSDPVANSYQITFTAEGRTRNTHARYPYSSMPRAYYVPAIGVVVTAGYAPRLDIIDLDGRLHRCIRVDLGDLSVTEEDRQAVFDLYNQIIRQAPNDQSRERLESQLKALKFGEKKAPWTSLKFDDQGYLYLSPPLLYGVSLDPREGVNYMVISPKGEYLGITKQPGGRSMEVFGGRLLVNYSDPETGECTLTVYDIRPIVEGLEFQ